MTTEKGLVVSYNARGVLESLVDNTANPPTVFHRTRYTFPGDFPEGPIRDLLFGADPEIVRAKYEGLNLKVNRPLEVRRISDSLPERNPRATPDGLEDSDDFSPHEPQSDTGRPGYR